MEREEASCLGALLLVEDRCEVGEVLGAWEESL